MIQKSAFLVFWSLVSGALLSAAGLNLANVAVGSSLQTPTTFKLSEPAPEGGLEVTLTSEDASRLKLSRRPDASGTDSIVVKVAAGFNESMDFWLLGMAGEGEVAYTATARSFSPGRGIVTLTPSAIVMVGPFKATEFKTTTGAASSRLVLYSVRLTPSMEYAEQQAVAAGVSLDIEILSSAEGVGVISPSRLSIPGGAPNAVSEFKPAQPGTTSITTSIPPGFSRPPAKYAAVLANVALPGLAITDQLLIGQNLQVGGNVGLGEAAGPGGVQVTLTSEDPAQLLISGSGTEVGQKSITVTVPPGAVSAHFTLQALGKAGTATYSASARGYSSRIGKIGLAPSGVVIAPSPYGPPDEAELFRKTGEGARGFISHLSKGKDLKMPLSVWTVQLDPITLRSADITVQPLRAGMSITVNVESSNPAAGKVKSPVVIQGGMEIGHSEFVALTNGTTLITAVTPSGFTKSTNSTTVEAIVKD